MSGRFSGRGWVPGTPRSGECGWSFRSGSGRYYDCGRSPGHEGGHAISDPAPAPERDDVDAEAARLWAEHHDHSIGGVFWQAACPACAAVPAEAFRLGYRAAALRAATGEGVS